MPQDALDDAFTELTRDRRAVDSISANSEALALMRGVNVTVRRRAGEPKTETVRVVDWDAPDANDVFFASQVWFSGDLYKRRADLVGFINGLQQLSNSSNLTAV